MVWLLDGKPEDPEDQGLLLANALIQSVLDLGDFPEEFSGPTEVRAFLAAVAEAVADQGPDWPAAGFLDPTAVDLDVLGQALRGSALEAFGTWVAVLLADGKIDLDPEGVFWLAVRTGHPGLVRWTLAAGTHDHGQDSEALLIAAWAGRTAVVRALLEAGANIHVWNDGPLYRASEAGHTGAVRALVKAGANVHAKDDEALRAASKAGHADVVQVLVEAGAGPDKATVRPAAGPGNTETRESAPVAQATTGRKRKSRE